MSDYHAELSPSSSARWLTCPGSVLATRGLDGSSDSPAAAEGTRAHEVAAWLADFLLGEPGGDLGPRPTADDDDMAAHAGAYAGYLAGVAALHEVRPTVLVETRVYPGVPSCDGTADAILYSAERIDVVDYKYGFHRVEAERNSQLMLYALGALAEAAHAMDYAFDYRMPVALHIFQPRIGNVSTWATTAGELYRWRDEVAVPAAQLALDEDSEPLFVPSPEACQWCPIAGTCRVRVDHFLSLDFGPAADEAPAGLDPDELATLFGQLPQIRRWADDVEGAASALVARGELPGYKLVAGRRSRHLVDDKAALAALDDSELWEESYLHPRKLLGIGALEKALPGPEFEAYVKPHIGFREAAPKVVAVEDARPDIRETAASDFDSTLPE